MVACGALARDKEGRIVTVCGGLRDCAMTKAVIEEARREEEPDLHSSRKHVNTPSPEGDHFVSTEQSEAKFKTSFSDNYPAKDYCNRRVLGITLVGSS